MTLNGALCDKGDDKANETSGADDLLPARGR